MKKMIVFTLAAALLFSFAAMVRADEPVSLKRQWKVGDRVAVTISSILNVKNTETGLGPMPTPGVTDDELKMELHALDVKEGKFQTLQVMVSSDDVQNQAPGAQHGQTSRGPLAGKKITLNRHVDPDFHEEKIDVTAEGSVLDPDIEENVRDIFVGGYIPDQPVPVGGRWTTDKVEGLFGVHTHGKLDFILRKIDQTPDGKRFALIEPSGQVTLDLGARLVPGGPAAGAAGDMTVIYTVGGSMRIDLSNGLPVAIDLNGETRIEHNVASGMPTVQHGTFSLVIKATPLESILPGQDTGPRIIGPTPAPDGNAPTTEPSPLSLFAGVYKAPQINLALKVEGESLTGTIEVKGQSYPIRAKLTSSGIAGTFQSNGSTFSFTASLDGDTLKLVTDNQTFPLKKQAEENPFHKLSTTQPANPLTR